MTKRIYESTTNRTPANSIRTAIHAVRRHYVHSRVIHFIVFIVSVVLPGIALTPAYAEIPAVGAQAPNFTLRTPQNRTVSMYSLLGTGPLVLIILRGYPGYQCPFCQRQVHDFIAHSANFAALQAKVLLVYPGPSAQLNQRATEFLESESQLPPNVVLVTDPDYVATNLYGLRWNMPNETAYPSTLILNKQGTILFEKISRSHGDRFSAEEALQQLRKP